MVSVIIPTYNNSKYIIEAINSVLSQSYAHFECIVIDDGSTDNTKYILHNFIRSKKIIYYYQENKGVSAARNLGVEKSKGNYLLFLDADDLLAGGALQFLIEDICEYDIVFGSWMDFDKDISITHQYSETKVNRQLTKYLIYKPTVSTALIKKEVIIDWDTTKKVWEVTDYFLTLILKDSKIKFSDRIVTKIRQHDNPSRASLLQDHFNPMQTLTFLKQWKERIKDKGMLDSEVEARIDTEIINNIYTASRNKINEKSLKPFYSLVNVNNLKNALTYKRYGLLFFIFYLKTFKAILIFQKLNSFFGRV